MKLRSGIIIALLALSLGACANNPFTKVWTTITGSTVDPTTVIVAANSFDALEATATNYLTLKRCTGTNGPICRNPVATAKIIPAIRSGRVARNNLEQFMKDNPGQLGPSGLYNALVASINTLQSVYATYNIGATQ
jgi:hypothetical protein